MLTFVLAAAALAAGVTGAWSPCGFSMVETLAPAGYAGRLRTTLVACATFTVGALVGGVITFGGLGLLGQWLGAGGTGAAAVAAVIAVAAAIGEARGVRIVPQVRRQVPESWRRVLPVPLAAGLYGVLLGLGFTTFILTFAVWALAAVSVALGDPALGAVLGLAFGIGRALPVIALAPVAETDRGNAAHAAMAERPGILRGLRAADAVALAACAVAMTTVAPASAATVVVTPASAPSAEGGLLAFQRPGPGGTGYLVRPDATVGLPGRDPALGAGLVGWRTPGVPDRARATGHADAGRELRGARRRAVRVQRPVGGVARRPDPARRSAARRLGAAARRSPARAAASSSGARRSSARPSCSTARARPAPRSACSTSPLNRESVVRTERRALLSNPTFDGGRLLYVRSTYTRQELRLGLLAPRKTTRDRILYRATPTARRDAGHEPGKHRHQAGYKGGKPPPLAPRPPAGVVDTLWTTALGPGVAYVTRLRKKSGVTTATLLSVPR